MATIDSTSGVPGMTPADNLDDLADVVITGTPADDEVLAYDTGTGKWINQTAAEAEQVAGPASSTDNAVMRWDGTGGDTAQDSGVLVDDSDNVTGVVGLTATGDITGAGIHVTGDTAAADAAALGYTATEGLILTGQGSTNDVTIKNDADAEVLGVPTGTVNITVAGTVDGRDLAADGTKLDGIEANADVTDATNVNAAGATMNTDTDVSANSWVIDEDTMVSDLATKVPTQQSVKAYVDSNAGIANVVEDATPQLGGGLDVNGNEITGAIDLHSSGDIIQELGDAAGANKVIVKDSAAVEVAAIDSDGNITTSGTVDGRDVAADGTKLDGIEASADVTDTANVTAAGALMDSELGAGVQTFLGTPSSANLASAVTDETGSGALCFATSPTLVTPALGTPASGTMTNCTGLPEAGLSISDNTTADVSTSAHGFAPKAPNDTGQVLLGDGTWGAVSAGAVDRVVLDVRNASGSAISKGDPVYESGYNVGQDRIEVTAADANTAATMPAVGLAAADIANNTNGQIITFGTLTGMDTSSYSLTDPLYVANGGGLTATKPVADDEIQKTGTVTRVHASSGVIFVSGANRSNDIPNFDAADGFWYGGTGGVQTEGTFAAGVRAFLETPSSANLATALTDETGTGANVHATSPTLVTPVLGTPSSGNLTSCTGYEGTAVASTGEAGGSKFLREDGDGTCSWQAVPGGGDLLAANNLSDVANAATSFGNIKQAASTTATGVVETATQAEVDAGSDTTRYVTPETLDGWAGRTSLIAILEHQETSGTHGGGATSGSWETRTLNTEVYDAGTEVSISSNIFTFANAGTYMVKWSAIAHDCGLHQSRLYSVDETAVEGYGTSEREGAATGTSKSEGSAIVTVTGAGDDSYRLEHQVASTQATDGYGRACSFGTEVYVRVEIYKIN